MAKSKLTALAVMALIGLGASAYLSNHFYQIRGGTAGFESVCNISKSMNCDVVAASPYAELIPGVPLSSVAAGWFLTLFFIALLARDTFWRREAVRGALVVTGVGTLASVIYFFIMLSVLKTFCLFCLLVDAVNLISLGLVLSLKPDGLDKHKPDTSKWKNMGAIAIGSLAVTVFLLKMTDPSAGKDVSYDDIVSSVAASPVISLNTAPELASMGAGPDAPITISEFSDFQCPFCRLGAFTIKTVMDRFPGKVRVIFRAFPLDPTCNPEVKHSMHPVACEAAKTALCANQQGKFQEVYEKMFQEQSSLARGVPAYLAKRAGVDEAKLLQCVDSPDIATKVSRDITDGITLGVQSTPTFFINGHRVDGAFGVEVWDKIIHRLVPNI